MNATQEIQNKVREAFNFSVVKAPLFGPDNTRTGLSGLFRDDDFSLVGNSSVKDRYTPHTTEDVVAIVDAASEAFDGDIDIQCNFKHGHYVTIAPSLDYRKQIYGTDIVFPRLLVNASYDGRAFRATMGMYRDMCRNMMMMRQVNQTSQAIRHTSGLRDKMDELIQTFSVLRESWDNIGDAIDHMNERKVDVRQFIMGLYGTPNENSSKSVTMHEKRMEAILTRLRDESRKCGLDNPLVTGETNGWLMYNAVQGYAQHDSIRRKDTTDFEKILSSHDDKFVKEAERLLLAAV